MVHTLVSIAFWLVFSALGLASLAFLLGTFGRSLQLDTVRSCIDDGSEDPESDSWKIYRISLKSDRLSNVAVATLLVLAASGVLAFVASTVLASVGVLGFVTVSAIVAKIIRARHVQLETRFGAITGMSLQEAYERLIERPAARQAQACFDQSVTLN